MFFAAPFESTLSIVRTGPAQPPLSGVFHCGSTTNRPARSARRAADRLVAVEPLLQCPLGRRPLRLGGVTAGQRLGEGERGEAHLTLAAVALSGQLLARKL